MSSRSLLRFLPAGAFASVFVAVALFGSSPVSAQQYPIATVPPSLVPPSTAAPTTAAPTTVAPTLPPPAAKAADPAPTVLASTVKPAPNVAVESVNISAASPAYTGSNSKAFAAIGAGLFGAGAVLVAMSRRRRPTAA